MSKQVFKVQTISVYISTTLVLLLLGIMGILFVGAQSVSEKMQESLGVQVIINKGTEESSIKSLEGNLQKKNYLGSMKYISEEQALEEEIKALGTDPREMLGGHNPYEASFEITLKPEYANADSLVNIEKELLRNKNVKEVIYQKELMSEVNSSIKKSGVAMTVLLVMLMLISWSQISNLVRLSIYSKRFLLHTMKLTGATWAFIRRPFIISNMLIGLTSGIVANLIILAGLYSLSSSEPAVMQFLPFGKLAVVGAIVILFGMSICSLCAFLSVNRFLRMRNNDLYFI